MSVDGDEAAKWFTAMLAALEMSRAEVRSLRSYARELHGEGASLLEQRDQLRGMLEEMKRAQSTGAAACGPPTTAVSGFTPVVQKESVAPRTRR